jgi:hypothetical protein
MRKLFCKRQFELKDWADCYSCFVVYLELEIKSIDSTTYCHVVLDVLSQPANVTNIRGLTSFTNLPSRRGRTWHLRYSLILASFKRYSQEFVSPPVSSSISISLGPNRLDAIALVDPVFSPVLASMGARLNVPFAEF